ncbi:MULTISPECIES: MotA/TolQ/ExbB proton channel family protein [unclassified Arsukibacterium]|uniref:MotA/TolQ/ExbB proton channel family protein n=2 Tax=Arsukibacterium TaxID=336830 RepID=UPI000C920791|nr:MULTISPECIES: MotA/TolQ/ExbB proton channel family protein [unclassified Arsukibacterium]MAA95145.1 flagellar motor protein MotA [Rheinheimera sp.]HAW94406.1 flagellar motor protein MotA [Candidatus Azambacteria bacterium]|tara:strand:+ start:4773 stop:6140 length:1368 start_codon:yes stop_codon:yes gene_type:complete
MRKAIKTLVVAAAVTLSASVAFNAAANTAQLDQLLEQIKKERAVEGRMNQERERAFLAERADKQALLNTAKKQFADEEARGKRLAKAYSENDILIAQKIQELESAQGTMGEVFGVVRQAANQTIGVITSSLISAQYPGREEPLRAIAAATELPTLNQMEDLWVAMLTEMTESAKIAKFDAEVVKLDGGSSTERVTRFGSFHLTTDDEYLIRNVDTDQIQPLGRQPQSKIHNSVAEYHNTAEGELAGLYVDPTKGNSLLRLNQQRSTLMEYYHQGGTVGYLITVLLFIGLLIALERFLVLTMVGGKMRSQLKNLANPSDSNPLGRILNVYHQNRSADVENLELKLDEAILRETPSIDRGIGLIKLFAAVAPLMGLLGTVIGMILTFQQITLYGTGDPKLMAGSISLALVTTALGLIAALPLLFVHSIVQAKAKSILHVLDEQSAGIVAAHAEKENA